MEFNEYSDFDLVHIHTGGLINDWGSMGSMGSIVWQANNAWDQVAEIN